MFFRTSMTSLMVTVRTFSFLDFLADLLQNPSQLPVICSPVVFFDLFICNLLYDLFSVTKTTYRRKYDKQIMN
jgi:hypothetical protein